MKRLLKAFAAALFMLAATPAGAQVTTPTWDENELESLRNFLRQPSTEGTSANCDVVGYPPTPQIDTSSWYTNTTWLNKLGIFTSTAVEVEGVYHIKSINFFNKQKFAGSFPAGEFAYLESLNLGSTGISSLGEKANTNIKTLTLTSTPFSVFEADKYPNLENLTLNGTKITEIDVSKNAKLKALDVQNTQITRIDITDNPSLTRLMCTNCSQLSAISFDHTLSIEEIHMGQVPLLKSIDLSSLANLNKIVSDKSGIERLDLSANTKIKDIFCRNMPELKSLILPPTAQDLTSVWAENSQLTEISGLENATNLTTLDVANNHIQNLDLSNNTALSVVHCNGNGLAEIKGLDKLTALTELWCQDNKLTSLSNLYTTNLRTLFMQNNRLRLSSTPTRTKEVSSSGGVITDQISTYTFFPQDTMNGGVFIAGQKIDLSSEYSKTFGDTEHKTRFLWFDITDGIETPLEVTASGNGIFEMKADYAGKTLRCKMTNAFFAFNNRQIDSFNFPFVYDVKVLSGNENYAETEIQQLKAFLRQTSALDGYCNAQVLEIDTTQWDGNNLWLYKTNGLELASEGNTYHIATIDWIGKQLAGKIDFSGFTQLTSLNVTNNRISALVLNNCPQLNNLKCADNLLRFSTLPKIFIVDGVFEMAPQALILGGRMDWTGKVDLGAEFIVSIGGVTEETEYKWFDISDGSETVLSSLPANANGVFSFTEEVAGKTLRCKMTNAHFKGQNEATSLTLIYEVNINKEALYDSAEVTHLKAFLRQTSALGTANFEQLGLETSDTARWNSSTSWLSYINGMEWQAMNDTNHMTSIDWSEKNLAGSLMLDNAKSLRALKLTGNKLTGISIADCAVLNELRINNNYTCSELNLSGCSALKQFFAQNCALQDIDISSCALIEHIYLFNNRIDTFNAKDKRHLTQLYLHNNQLVHLDVSGCSALTRLNVSENELKELNVNVCPLTFLDCAKNRLTFATLPQKAFASYDYAPQAEMPYDSLPYTAGSDLTAQNMVTFDGETSGVTSKFQWFDITDGSEKPADSLDITNNNGKFIFGKTVSGLDLRCKITNEKFPGLTLVYHNILQEPLDWYDAGEIENLRYFLRQESYHEGIGNYACLGLSDYDTLCWNKSGKWLVRLQSKHYTRWSISNDGNKEAKRLISFDIPSTGVAGCLDLSSCTELLQLNCVANEINKLDVSGCGKIGMIWCYRNKISELDLENNNALGMLYCGQNDIESIELKNHPKLQFLDCSLSQLTKLDVSGCPALLSLNCRDNQLKELDVTKNTRLTSLSCGKNYLHDLDLKQNQELSEFNAQYNYLKFFDLTYNPKMWHLTLDHNLLNGIVLSGLTIESVDISYNKLTYATIPFDFRRKDYYFAPQDTVELGTIGNGESLDISEQYVLDEDGSHTFYKWEELSGSTFVATDKVDVLDERGIFAFKENAIGKRFRCTLTNNNFYRSALTLEFFVSVIQTTNNGAKESDNITVYPNPTSGMITVSSQKGINHIEVYNTKGRLLLEKQSHNADHIVIDLSAFPSGLYFIKAENRIMKIIRQ